MAVLKMKTLIGHVVATWFLSGLLGTGGIKIAPLLLYDPPLLGLKPLTIRVLARLTIVHGLVAFISGALTHRRFHFVSGRQNDLGVKARDNKPDCGGTVI